LKNLDFHLKKIYWRGNLLEFIEDQTKIMQTMQNKQYCSTYYQRVRKMAKRKVSL
jgi:hypothetical protein